MTVPRYTSCTQHRINQHHSAAGQYLQNSKIIYTGHAKKSNPLGKIRYLWNCSNFFAKFTAFTEEDSGHILQISLQYLVAFKNYNYLNLNVHFSK